VHQNNRGAKNEVQSTPLKKAAGGLDKKRKKGEDKP
jgi:hypothetical protein